MGLRSDMQEAISDGFADMGEDATFIPATGSVVVCKVLIDFNVLLQPSGMDAQVWERGTKIEALLADLGREPNRGEIFTVDGIAYTVQGIIENDGITVKMVVT